MSWAKLDDRFHENRKVRGLWRKQPAALGLHVMALTYCAGHETDGLVDNEFVEDKVASASTRRKLTGALVDAGLWVVENDGWRIHDYLDFHPSRAELEAKRAADRERKARGGRNGTPGDRSQTPGGVREDSERNPAGLHAASESPVPTRPDHIPNNTARGAVRYGGKAVPQPRLVLAEQLLADFNSKAGTAYRPFGAGGKPTEPFKRILGAVVEHPELTVELGERVNTVGLASPFWEGPAQPGNVWGPNVVDRNLQAAVSGARSDDPGFTERKNAKWKARQDV